MYDMSFGQTARRRSFGSGFVSGMQGGMKMAMQFKQAMKDWKTDKIDNTAVRKEDSDVPPAPIKGVKPETCDLSFDKKDETAASEQKLAEATPLDPVGAEYMQAWNTDNPDNTLLKGSDASSLNVDNGSPFSQNLSFADTSLPAASFEAAPAPVQTPASFG